MLAKHASAPSRGRPMRLSIRDGIYCCRCAERVIVLDARAGRYFMISERLSPAFLRLWDGSPQAQDPVLLSGLISAGIITTDQEAPRRDATLMLPPAKRELTAQGSQGVGWFEIASAVFCQVAFRLSLRRRKLALILADLEGEDGPSIIADGSLDERIVPLAAAFRATSGIIRQQDQCLPRSLAFARLCRRKGVNATLVIGVTLDPFSAHAWVQAGDVVLSDTVERVRCYTPILAV